MVLPSGRIAELKRVGIHGKTVGSEVSDCQQVDCCGGGGGGGADRKLSQRPRPCSAAVAQGNDNDITWPSEEGFICVSSMEAAEFHSGSRLLCLGI